MPVSFGVKPRELTPRTSVRVRKLWRAEGSAQKRVGRFRRCCSGSWHTREIVGTPQRLIGKFSVMMLVEMRSLI